MAKQGIVTTYDDAGFPSIASSTFPVAAAAGTVTAKAGAGRLLKVVVTATGTGIITIYDNASTGSGVILFVVPASPPVGTIYSLDLPAINGITAVSAATPSAVTIGYS